MKKTTSSAKEQFIGPLVLVVIGVVIVGLIGYFGRSARKNPSSAAPPASPSAAKPDAPDQSLPARYRPADAPADLVLAFDPLYSKGDKKAPVVLVEFSDYQ